MTRVVEFEARSSIEAQAREWLIRLDGDEPLTAAEKRALHEWLARSPLHREALTRLSKFWNQANLLTELAVPLQKHRRAHVGRRVAILAGVAAALAVVTVAAGWLWHASASRSHAYVTAVGQQQTVDLPDGSTIQLNTDSQVQVAFSDRSRTILLLRGEALFTVTPDPSRPFDVYAGEGRVRAVGTAFAVRLKGEELNVTVTKGVVAIADVGRQIANAASDPAPRELGRLRAGQATTLRSHGDATFAVHDLGEREAQRRVSWHEGYLTFADEPLAEVIDQVNRYSPVTLMLADPQLAAMKVGARFKIGDLDGVLDVLQAQFEITATRVDERTIRLEAARAH